MDKILGRRYTKDTRLVEKVSFQYSKCTIPEVRDCEKYAKEYNICIKILTKLCNTDMINAIGKRYYYKKEDYVYEKKEMQSERQQQLLRP